MQSFLGLIGHYWRFVDGFSEIAASMMAVIHKNVKFEWTDACQQSFQKLKKRFETIQILTNSDGEDDFLIYCEALGQGLGAALMR